MSRRRKLFEMPRFRRKRNGFDLYVLRFFEHYRLYRRTSVSGKRVINIDTVCTVKLFLFNIFLDSQLVG